MLKSCILVPDDSL